MSDASIRVLHIARRMSGGVRVHITQLCNELYPNIYQQELVTNVEDSDVEFHTAFSKQVRIRQAKIVRGLQIGDIRNIFEIYLIARRLKFEIIHGHGSKGGFYARIVGYFLNSKVVYTPHGGIAHDQGFSLGAWAHICLEKMIFGITDAFVFESNFTRTQFIKRVGERRERFFVNHNGIEIRGSVERTQSFQIGSQFSISAYGRLEYAKGYDLLISAIHILVNKYRINVLCHIFGEGDERGNLQRQIKELKSIDYISLSGFASDASKSMENYNVVVLPSRYESFGYVALEAMVAGTPLIVTEVGGLREIVTNGHDGLIANPDAKDIAKKLYRLYSDSSLRRNLVQNAYLTVAQKFSLDRMIDGIDEIYQSLLLNQRTDM